MSQVKLGTYIRSLYFSTKTYSFDSRLCFCLYVNIYENIILMFKIHVLRTYVTHFIDEAYNDVLNSLDLSTNLALVFFINNLWHWHFHLQRAYLHYERYVIILNGNLNRNAYITCSCDIITSALHLQLICAVRKKELTLIRDVVLRCSRAARRAGVKNLFGDRVPNSI